MDAGTASLRSQSSVFGGRDGLDRGVLAMTEEASQSDNAQAPAVAELKGRSVVRRALAIAWPVVSVIMLAMVCVDIGFEWRYAPNRSAICEVMSRVQRGMPRPDVERLVLQYEPHFFSKHDATEELVYQAHANALHAWVLRISFSADERVKAASVRSDDGHHPRSAPPDVR